jgi:hypothetical protein
MAVGVFHLTTIRNGHEWADDFSLYIMHAKNLVEGVNYQQTGYIFNPHMPLLGPKTYPPVFPLLLSPIYLLWGLNMTAMKIEIVALFALALIAIFLAFKDQLSRSHLILLIALIGFNPYLYLFKNNIVSDLPFILFLYLGLYLIHKQFQVEPNERSNNLRVLMLSLVIYLAYGTRSIGLVLLPGLIVADIMRNRRLSWSTIKITILTGVFIILQNLLLHSDRSYTGHFGISLSSSIRQAWEYTSEFSAVIVPSTHDVVRSGLFAAITILVLIGCYFRIKDRVTIFELFPVVYLIPLLILPIDIDVRFLIPVIPLFFLYALLGVQAITRGGRREDVALLCFLAIIFASYTSRYIRMDNGSAPYGVAQKEALDFFNYVKTQTGKNDVLVFRRPRALALFTGRKASTWHQPEDDQALWSYLRQIHANYLVLGPKEIDTPDQEYIGNFIARHRDMLQETYSNGDFWVYRIIRTAN